MRSYFPVCFSNTQVKTLDFTTSSLNGVPEVASSKISRNFAKF
ncbi:hypothetical protein HMPREF1362_00954 [Enterococcus faecium ERV102]|nr:hypothetical protein HMPREF1362_00954 [Enterococcus faecium ERV102]